MSDIINRYKKLQKLAKLSSNVINEFGFLYFVNTAMMEFKKKGFSVFQPELEQPEPEYSESHAYKTWIYKHVITNTSESKIREQIQAFSTKPNMLIVISVLKFDKNNLKKTIDSLKEQIYSNFEVHVFYSKSAKKDDEIVHELSETSIKSKFKLETKSINEFLLAENYEFIIFIKSGDVLTKDALFRIADIINKVPDVDVIYSDVEQIDENHNPFFKPDWAPDLFLSFDYISNFYAVSMKLLKETHGFRQEFDNALHYDLLLRLTEITGKIVHIPIILASIDTTTNAVPHLSSVEADERKALVDALKRRAIKGEVMDGKIRKSFRIRYALEREPKVSIIIPTKDQKTLLKRCLTSIQKRTSYRNYEIIIVDNNSEKEETSSYLKSLPHKVIRYDAPFNFSKINNMAATYASGDYLLFLNDDTAILEPQWLTELVSIGEQDNVGVVGPKLVLSNNVIQHAGIALLKTGAAFHPFAGLDANDPGYFGFLNMTRNCSAVTGACLLVKKKLFEKVGGFDEIFDLYYQDVDLCLKIIKFGYKVVYTPYAVLLHEGSSTIKKNMSSFFAVENHYQFYKKWSNLKTGDPFYNPNLGLNYKIST